MHTLPNAKPDLPRDYEKQPLNFLFLTVASTRENKSRSKSTSKIMIMVMIKIVFSVHVYTILQIMFCRGKTKKEIQGFNYFS
jgi:hypothetical protein